jgi:hypothetical protein
MLQYVLYASVLMIRSRVFRRRPGPGQHWRQGTRPGAVAGHVHRPGLFNLFKSSSHRRFRGPGRGKRKSNLAP